MQKLIPPTVRRLLGFPWVPDTTTSAFEPNWHENRRRQRDPSYYRTEQGWVHPDKFHSFSHPDAVALIKDGTFRDLALIERPPGDKPETAINEHAFHALRDFMCATYAAWEVYQARLDTIAQHSPRPKTMYPEFLDKDFG